MSEKKVVGSTGEPAVIQRSANSSSDLVSRILTLLGNHSPSSDETRRALRKQCAVEEPAIGVGCWAKQATHHAVKSWWEARA